MEQVDLVLTIVKENKLFLNAGSMRALSKLDRLIKENATKLGKTTLPSGDQPSLLIED